MIWQQIDVPTGEVTEACIGTEQLPANARRLLTPDTDVLEGVPNYVLWDHPIRTAEEAERWTARARSGMDPLYVMKYQPELGVFCEIPHSQRGVK